MITADPGPALALRQFGQGSDDLLLLDGACDRQPLVEVLERILAALPVKEDVLAELEDCLGDFLRALVDQRVAEARVASHAGKLSISA
jgi:hypothetical protein